ncbi:MAG: hypothetical protein H0V55_01900 [Thermoleophilaceae bacterium]|jgi:hypothetical protein|nr:hypothetical protein [Thermoleophilaceae bacterium]
MTTALVLLSIQGVIGAFDTLYYHEWRARLPAQGRQSASELKLHAGRDFLYAVLFGTLPWLAWQGLWVIALVAVLVGEIVLTLWDFVAEIAARKTMGDVYAGERVTHAVMGILYGAMAAFLIPVLVAWWSRPTAFGPAPDVPWLLQWALTAMAVGVFLSGVRDLYAALGLPHGHWPWPPRGVVEQQGG